MRARVIIWKLPHYFHNNCWTVIGLFKRAVIMTYRLSMAGSPSRTSPVSELAGLATFFFLFFCISQLMINIFFIIIIGQLVINYFFVVKLVIKPLFFFISQLVINFFYISQLLNNYFFVGQLVIKLLFFFISQLVIKLF